MNRKEFDQYLACFNSRDYEGLKRYLADDITLKFAGYSVEGKNGFDRFYGFFHDHVDEEVQVRQFAGDAENVIIDTVVRLTGKKKLLPAVLKHKGYERLMIPAPGEVKEIPQLIHYRIEKGKFKEIRCVIKD